MVVAFGTPPRSNPRVGTRGSTRRSARTSVQTAQPTRRGLPPEPGPFIGRDSDLRRLGDLALGGCRVLTLVGPGGMGKTRLALHWATAQQGTYVGGAYFADLAACTNEAGFLAAVGAALEVPIAAGGPDAVRLGAQLAGHGRALVVLDNFEQLVDSCAASLHQLSESAPEATFLVTSREPLRISRERVIELVPIGLPDASDDAATIAQSDAYRLLHDRVAVVRGSFDPDPAELTAAGALVRRLDGIPLAIELAASRLGTLGTRALLADLSRGIDALGGMSRGKPERHRTLRAAIDWSLALLSDDEATAFAEIGVFQGGLDAHAAAAVLSGPHPIERLDALREKALLRAFEPRGLPGTRRLAPYDSLGEVAREKLEAHPRAAEVRWAHACHYAKVAQELRRRVDENDDAEAVRLLALERENLEAALRTLIEVEPRRRGAAEHASWIVLALEPVRAAAGAAESTHASAHLVRATFAKLPPMLEARLLEVSAIALSRVARRADAAAVRDEAILLARKARDRGLEGRLLLARAHGSITPTADVIADVEAALAILREHGLPRDRAVGANELAARLMQLDDTVTAERLFLESVRAFRAVGDRQWEGIALCQIAILRLEGGRADEARAVVAEAVRLAADDVGWNVSAMASQASGHLAHVEGDLDAARAAFDRAIAMYRRVAHPLYVGLYLGYAGIVERERGALEQACALFDEACGILSAQDEKQHRTLFLAHWGATLAWRGDEGEAQKRLAEATEVSARQSFRGVTLVVEIEHAHLDLARAARAERDHDVRAAAAARRRAVERLERFAVKTTSGVDAQISDRIARRALGASRASSPPPAPSETHPELVVDRDARWLTLPDGTRIGLTSRHLARRLLLALVEARLLEPGARVSHATLLEAGWPGERMRSDSARNRLYVAMSTLRKLGLARIVESETEGYRLAPDVPLRLSE
jgi:predicted ATPase